MAETNTTTSGPCLLKVNVDNKAEETLLYEQRVICGWKSDVVPQMFEQMRQQLRTLYWVCVPSESSVDVSTKGTQILPTLTKEVVSSSEEARVHIPLLSTTQSKPANQQDIKDDLLPVGHVSIDFEDFGVKLTPLLGSSDGRIISISTLFVLPCYRKLGLANWAMGECERLIRSGSMHDITGDKVKCEIISLSSMSVRHWNMPGPDGAGRWERVGKKPGRYLGDWYKSLGYERITEMEKYKDRDVDGRDAYWWCEVWHKRL